MADTDKTYEILNYYGLQTNIEDTKKWIKQYVYGALTGITTDLMISGTYDEIKSWRDNGELKPGMLYRMTDFCTYCCDNYGAKSAEHHYDLILLALSNNSLSEDVVGFDLPSNGDTYFSDAKANLSAWEGKYCLDNDWKRFMWAPGRGLSSFYIMDESGDDMFDIERRCMYNTSLEFNGQVLYCFHDYLHNFPIIFSTTNNKNELTIENCFLGYDENDDEIWDMYVFTYKKLNRLVPFSDEYPDKKITYPVGDTNAKGVINYLKDEWGNDADYDFKNILFERAKIKGIRDNIESEFNNTYVNTSEYTNFSIYTDKIHYSYSVCMHDYYDNKPHDLTTDQYKYKNDENGYSFVVNNHFCGYFYNMSIIEISPGDYGDYMCYTNILTLGYNCYVIDTNICHIEPDYSYGEFGGVSRTVFKNSMFNTIMGSNNLLDGSSYNTILGGTNKLNSSRRNIISGNRNTLNECQNNTLKNCSHYTLTKCGYNNFLLYDNCNNCNFIYVYNLSVIPDDNGNLKYMYMCEFKNINSNYGTNTIKVSLENCKISNSSGGLVIHDNNSSQVHYNLSINGISNREINLENVSTSSNADGITHIQGPNDKIIVVD